MGLTAHQPQASTKGEESIGKPNTKKTNIKIYRRKETLQQALQNKGKNLTAQGRRSGRIKLLLPECLWESP